MHIQKRNALRPKPDLKSHLLGLGLGTLILAMGVPSARASEDRASEDRASENAPAVQYGASLTVDGLDNVSGGLRKGAWGMSNLDLTAAWQGAAGWEAFGYILIDQHGGFSERYSGDAQVVSNIDAPAGVRLFEAYARHTTTNQAHVTTFGIINLNGLFDTQPTGGLFLNSSHGIGPDYSQSGPSIFPFTGLGFVEEWRVTDLLRLRAGVFDAVPGDPFHQTVFSSLRLSKAEGLNYVGEIEQNFTDGFVKIGHWSYTARADRLDGIGQGVRSGTYAQVAWTLSHETADPDQGLAAWIRAGTANADVLEQSGYLGGGLVYTGLLKGRDHDQIGLAFASATFGQPYRDITPDSAGHETTIEATYQAEIKPGLIVQPDIQYIRHPGGLTTVDDALVVGIRMRLNLIP